MVGIAAIFSMAQQKGWQNPRKGKRPPENNTPQNQQASGNSTGNDDNQTGTTALIDKALELAEQGDIEALQNTAVLEALAKVRAVNELAYQKYRSRVQGLKKKPFSLSFMDRETKPPKPPRYTEQGDDGGEGGSRCPGKADLFIEMVKQWAETFTDESGVPYVSFVVEPVDAETGEVLPPHVETYPMHSDKFQSKAGREFYRRFGTVVGDSAMKEAISVLAADADEGATGAVYLRCAMPPETGKVYIDLGDDSWQVVEITAQGWQVIESADCPVKFRRVRHAQPLPNPETGGNIDRLWHHLNVQGDDAQLLVLAWLLAAMLTGLPYPVLEIIAGQGSAKSTTQERLKVLIDPNHSNLRKEPDSILDLSVSAGSNHVISLNNLSHIGTAQ